MQPKDHHVDEVVVVDVVYDHELVILHINAARRFLPLVAFHPYRKRDHGS